MPVTKRAISDAERLSPQDRYLGRSTLPTEGAQFQWTPEMVKELQKCQKDLFYFAEKHFYISALDQGKILIPLFKAQRRLLKSLLKNRFVVITSSRQSSKTTLMTLYALWLVCFNPDYRVLIVANKEDTAIKIFKRIKMAYEMLANYVKPAVKEWGATGFTLANDSSIGISTTTSDAARGDTVNLLIIDELAHIQENLADEFWKSTVPIISSSKTAKIFAVSTPNGSSNLFARIYNGAVKKEAAWSAWKAERIDWWEVPGRDHKWKQVQIGILGSAEFFRQEFENVFLESGQTPIDVDVIEKLKATARPPKFTLEDGDYKIFKEPIENHLYSIGVDVSEGIGQASSVVQIFDITDLTQIDQVAVYCNNKIDPYSFAGKIVMIANQWGRPPLLVERNNCGGQVIDALLYTHQYSNLVDYVPGKERLVAERRGIYAHTNSKYKGIMNWRYWVNILRCVSIADMSTIREMETFIRYPNGTWKAKPGDNVWDDRVMAMIWSIFALDTDIAQRYFDIAEYDDKGKPSKLAPLEFVGREYFRLDKSTIVGDEMTMPIFLGVAPAVVGRDNIDIHELESQGWEFPKY